jgi:transcriptional regulator with XRE-family HTH domain
MQSDEGFNIDFNTRRGFLSPEVALIDPPRVDVYLAGPLTNNDNPTIQAECDAVRSGVKRVLHCYNYLGVEFNIYDPADFTPPGTVHSAEEVYAIDHRWTVRSDLVIFHINTPSLGVGIEAQLSALATTPRVIISKGEVPTSRMFQGMFCSTIAEIRYQYASEVADSLRDQLQDICPKVIESAERRRPHLQQIIEQRLGERLLMQRIRHGVSIADVARHTDVQKYWLREIERHQELAATMGNLLIERVAESLRCSINQIETGVIKITDDDGSLLSHQEESLRNLARFTNRTESPSEERIFTLWRNYIDTEQRQAQEALAFRDGANAQISLSVEEWRQRYEESGLFG